jgi:ribosome-associated protein YbcJ (S4-like RNA binding protein)
MITETRDPIEFCPAAACAAAIVRIEGFIDHVARLMDEARLARSPDLMAQLEAISGELILAADEARDRLAKVQAVSSAGAMAQLLAAIRDVRMRDEAESRRAKDLEAKAVRFLANASLYDAAFCKSLSGTKLGGRLHIGAPGPRPADAPEARIG